MLETVLADPFWVTSEVTRLAKKHLVALLTGRIAVIRIPSMLDVDQCAALMRQVDELPRKPYESAPPIARFGPALNDNRRPGGGFDDEKYWTTAEYAMAAWSSASLQPDPVDHALDYLARAWRRRILRAKWHGRDLYAGIVRDIEHGTLVHYDEVIREFSEVDIKEIPFVAQLAFNLYLSVPQTGGTTTIWRRKWEPGDEAWRMGYGYSDDVVAGYPSIQIKPNVGEGLLFDCRYLHKVEANADQRRVAIAFFLGLTCGGDLLVWS